MTPKIVKRKPAPRGAAGEHVTVHLAPGEQLLVLRPDTHYKLGGQIDDIMPTFVIEEMREVFWNAHEQKWSEA